VKTTFASAGGGRNFMTVPENFMSKISEAIRKRVARRRFQAVTMATQGPSSTLMWLKARMPARCEEGSQSLPPSPRTASA
jgi:hypothetical protein